MPKSYSTSELYETLEATNKKFASLLKKNTEVSHNYMGLAEAYQRIIASIAQAKSTNAIKELYRLESHLGLIQCQLNATPLSINDEADLQKNNAQIETLGKELTVLKDTTLKFQEKIRKNKSELKKDYTIFLSQLNTYKASWNTHCYNIQAAYYYNYAEFLRETTTKKNCPFATCKKNLEKSIYFFAESACLYEKNKKMNEKKETDAEINKTRLRLKALNKKRNLNNLKIATINSTPIKKEVVNRPINLPISCAKIKSPVQTKEKLSEEVSHTIVNKNQTLPLKKRKLSIETTTLDSKKNHFKKISLDKTQAISLEKNISSSCTNFEPIISEQESLENEKFNQLAIFLKKKEATDPISFYLQLFFDLSNCINLEENNKNIFNHNLLTKLYLLDTIIHLINLLCTKKTNFFIHLENQTLHILNKLNANYSVSQGWKFFHLDELKKITLDKKGLRNLFLSEIKNYLWGIEAIGKNINLCDNILHTIYQLINNFISTNPEKFSIEIVIARAETFLKKIPERAHLFFYSRLSREIVKFYIAPENKEWAEKNKIPLNNSLFVEELINWLLLAKKLASIINDQSFIKKIVSLEKTIVQEKMYLNKKTLCTQHFLNSIINAKEKLIRPTQIFYQQFKAHLERFYYSYDIPLPILNPIFETLIQFIQTQVDNFDFCADRPITISINSH